MLKKLEYLVLIMNHRIQRTEDGVFIAEDDDLNSNRLWAIGESFVFSIKTQKKKCNRWEIKKQNEKLFCKERWKSSQIRERIVFIYL